MLVGDQIDKCCEIMSKLMNFVMISMFPVPVVKNYRNYIQKNQESSTKKIRMGYKQS